MKNGQIDFVLFDLIGTTVQDNNKDGSFIIDNLKKAFSLNGFHVSFIEINQYRGITKKEIINKILIDHNQDHTCGNLIYQDFISFLNKSLGNLQEIVGAKVVFNTLIDNGIRIGIGSGLPMDLIIRIINNVGWKIQTFDYIGSSEVLGKSRPDPIMINDSMRKLKIKDRLTVLKVGDTIVDIQEGKNAGVMTASVLTGTQRRQELEAYEPDYVFPDIQEILTLI